MIVLSIFIGNFSYAKRVRLTGELMSSAGVLRVHTPADGILVERHVAEGQHVARGAPLFTVDLDRYVGAAGIQGGISAELTTRIETLEHQRQQAMVLQSVHKNATQEQINLSRTEEQSIAQRIAGQQQRIELASASGRRSKDLLGQGFISLDVAQRTQEQLLDQEDKLRQLERELSSTRRQRATLSQQLTTQFVEDEHRLATIDSSLAIARAQFSDSEGKRRITLRSPHDGIVVGISVAPGQAVNRNMSLAQVLPPGAALIAQLYATSRAVGLVKPQQVVRLRYPAFPYQEFGQYDGVVNAVDRASLDPSAVSNVVVSSAEPLFRVQVSLARQQAARNGENYPLRPGMLVESDVQLESRRLYQWLLDPVLGRVQKGPFH